MLAKNFFWPAPDTPPQSFFNYCNSWVTGIKKEWSAHWCADIAHFVGGNLDKIASWHKISKYTSDCKLPCLPLSHAKSRRGKTKLEFIVVTQLLATW